MDLETAQEEKKQAEEDVAEENEAGFDRALSQVRVLYPNLDLSVAGFEKDVVDGCLVDV